MHLFYTAAWTALGSMPTLYCDEKFSSASVDLSCNKSYHQLVSEYGYLHQFSHGQSQIHQQTSTRRHHFLQSVNTFLYLYLHM